MDNKIRIQKVLSDAGILSRRKTEEYIKAGRIKVNGRPAAPGHAVDPRKDVIAVDGVKVEMPKRKNSVYYMLYKPRGYVTTMSDELGRRCVAEFTKDLPERIYPIGRLDRDSEGLLLLTNDGDFANTVMHPSSRIGKTYRVTVHSELTEDKLIKLSTGVVLDDGVKTGPAQVHVLEKAPGRAVIQITIYEGKNRQIRRMCEAVHLDVARLKRISVGPLKIGMLAPGKLRELKPSELTAIRNAVSKGMNQEAEILDLTKYGAETKQEDKKPLKAVSVRADNRTRPDSRAGKKYGAPDKARDKKGTGYQGKKYSGPKKGGSGN